MLTQLEKSMILKIDTLEVEHVQKNLWKLNFFEMTLKMLKTMQIY
jgi:hypothetical protein